MDLPDKKYQIIYADPPWRYNDKRVSITSDRPQKYGGITYLTMTIDDLCKLPIKEIADTNCILFLWVTMPLLEDCFQIFKAWGFSYRTCGFVWVKRNKNNNDFRSGLGSYTNCNAELCLIGVKGKCLERKRKDIKQIVFSSVELHSRKPIEVAKRIEMLYGNVPRIELFARNRFDGWDAWGDQLSDTIQNKIEG
jgi:site-specific DNA-methyltransferase (adenine-specific)